MQHTRVAMAVALRLGQKGKLCAPCKGHELVSRHLPMHKPPAELMCCPSSKRLLLQWSGLG